MTYGILRNDGKGDYIKNEDGWYKKFCENCKQEIHEVYQGLINMGDMNHKCYSIDNCPYCGRDL